jgi:hypothetical protein
MAKVAPVEHRCVGVAVGKNAFARMAARKP